MNTQTETWPTNDTERAAFSDWQAEVGNGDTVRGFRDWMAAQVEDGDDTQTEPRRPRPKPGTEIRADELDGLRSVSIEHPDTGELFTVAKVAWHGDTILLTDYEGSETDIDRDSGVMVVAACAVCEHEIAEDYGLCPSCLHNAKRSGWTPGDPMSDFTGGA